jgi:hypothetical protein
MRSERPGGSPLARRLGCRLASRGGVGEGLSIKWATNAAAARLGSSVRSARRIATAGKPPGDPFKSRRTFADKNHVRTDIMTDILRAV